MITAPVKDLERIAELHHRPEDRAEYVADCLAHATVTDGMYTMADVDFVRLRKKWSARRPGRDPVTPIVVDLSLIHI